MAPVMMMMIMMMVVNGETDSKILINVPKIMRNCGWCGRQFTEKRW